MLPWHLVILGSGSARPTAHRAPSAQALCIGRRIYLVDCGEATQMQLSKAAIPLERIAAVFVTHLHADHTLGLFGLLASLSMTGRTAPLAIYAHAPLEAMIAHIIELFIAHLNFEICFHALPDEPGAEIYSDSQISVTTIPLHHRIPTLGFKFAEHPLPPNIRPEIVARYQLSRHEIARLKAGEEVALTSEATILRPSEVLYQRRPPRAFAYMTDTLFTASAAPFVRGVDLLYHEATYTQDLLPLAKQTGHSTAQQAAEFARLAEVKRLVIGHYSARYHDLEPLLAEAQHIFPATVLAKELDIHTI